MIFRCLLFVPGNKSSMLEKALGLRPDAFVPDMEDSVPAAEKANARALIRELLPRLAATRVPVIPRVNALETDWIEDDLAAVIGPAILGVSFGKVRTPGDVRRVAAIVAQVGKKVGIAVGTTNLLPWIETAEAIVNCYEICKASERVIAVAF